jgi:hypothetical protein
LSIHQRERTGKDETDTSIDRSADTGDGTRSGRQREARDGFNIPAINNVL